MFHCHTVIGMAQFIPVFYVHEASTQQAVVRWGEVYFSHINSSSSCLVGIFGDPLGLRSEWGCWVSKGLGWLWEGKGEGFEFSEEINRSRIISSLSDSW